MSSFSANMGLMLGWDNRILSNRSCWFHGVYLQLQGSIKYVMFVLAAGYLSKRYCVIKPTVLINQRCFSYFVKYFLDLTKKNVCFFFFVHFSLILLGSYADVSHPKRSSRSGWILPGECLVRLSLSHLSVTFSLCWPSSSDNLSETACGAVNGLSFLFVFGNLIKWPFIDLF